MQGKRTKESRRNLVALFGDMCIFALGDMCFLLLKQGGLLLLVKTDAGFALCSYLLYTLLRSLLPAVFWRVPVLHRDEAGKVMWKINKYVGLVT